MDKRSGKKKKQEKKPKADAAGSIFDKLPPLHPKTSDTPKK